MVEEVRRGKSTQPWLRVIWRVCNLFMSAFFALATYVQVSVRFVLAFPPHPFEQQHWASHVVSVVDQWSGCGAVDGEWTHMKCAPIHVWGASDLCCTWSVVCRSVTVSPQSCACVPAWTRTWQVGSRFAVAPLLSLHSINIRSYVKC